MEATIGGYRLVEKVGRGGFGTVWRAVSAHGAEVALKVVHADIAEEAESHARLLNEFAVLTRLNHPNIVQVHSVLSHEDRLVLVMDFVRGRTLTSELARRGAMPMPEGLSLMAQVSSAVACAHRSGIVHRDLKPDNLLIDGNGSARLVDFGIALAAGSSRHTSTGLVVGTPSYVAPELIRGAEPGPASDVYAIGLLTVECVTGRRLFDGANTAEVFNRQLTESPRLPDGLPREVAPLVTACLEKDPANRPSAERVEHAFSGLLPPTDTVTTVVIGVPPVSPQRGTLKSVMPVPADETTKSVPVTVSSARRPVIGWLAALAALLVAAAAVTALLVTQRSPAVGLPADGETTTDAVPTVPSSNAGSVTGTATTTGSGPATASVASASPAPSVPGSGTAPRDAPTRTTPADVPGPGVSEEPPPAPPTRTPVTFANDVDRTIPDNQPTSFSGTTITVDVPEDVVAGAPGVRVVVSMKIVHERRGDLTVRLRTPDGGRLTLVHANPADTGRDIVRTVDVTDLLRDGSPISGVWSLVISDGAEGATGRLDSWSIVV